MVYASRPFRGPRSWGDGEFLLGLGLRRFKVRAPPVKSRILAGAFFESGQVDGVGNAARFTFLLLCGATGPYLYVGGFGSIRASISHPPGFHGCEQLRAHKTSGAIKVYLYALGQTIERFRFDRRGARFAGDPVYPQDCGPYRTAARCQKPRPVGVMARISRQRQCSIRKVVIATAEVTTLVGVNSMWGNRWGLATRADRPDQPDLGQWPSFSSSDSSSVRAVDLATGVRRLPSGSRADKMAPKTRFAIAGLRWPDLQPERLESRKNKRRPFPRSG